MNTRLSRHPWTNPALIGSITVAVTLIAVFLAYTANRGLPFVPSRLVKVDFANGAELYPGYDVREGGQHVGVVTAMTPVRRPDGSTVAQVELRLPNSVLVPASSTFDIRPQSLLGVKFVELNRGPGRRSVPTGYVFGPAQGQESVDLDRLFDIFDQPTRLGEQRVTEGTGDTWAGRGSDVNQALVVLPSTLYHLTLVMATLADPHTDLAGFFQSLDGTMRVLAPINATFAHLFSTMADTAGAIAHDPNALERTIAKSPSTLSVSTTSLAIQRPFYEDTVVFSDDLTRATDQLGPTLPALSAALEAGPPVLRRSVAMDEELEGSLRALRDLTRDPFTSIALEDLLSTVQTMRPLIRYLGPFQTVCDYWNYYWTDLSDHLSEQDPNGTAERALLNSAGQQNNGVASSDAVVPANGEGYVSASGPRGDPQYFHGQEWGAAIDNQGNADCETGQRGYMFRYAQGVSSRFDIVTNDHTPGDQGPTFKGRRRVPPGETYDRVPQGDPVLP